MRRPLTPEAFTTELSNLDRSAFRAFVADLWRARGYRVDPVPGDGSTLLSVVPKNDKGNTAPRIFQVTTGGLTSRLENDPDRPVDVIVTPERDPSRWRLPRSHRDAAIVDGADLRELTLFAIDGESSRELCERYLGTSPYEVVPDPSPDPSPQADPGSESRRQGSLMTGLAVVLLVVAAVAGPFVVGQVAESRPTDNVGTEGSDPVTTASTTDHGGERSGDEDASSTADSFLISREDIRNPERLARAHGVLLSRPYWWELKYTAIRNGTSIVRMTQTFNVAGPNEFRGDLSRNGSEFIDPWMLDDGDVYADGVRYYQRRIVNGTNVYAASQIELTTDPPPLLGRAYGLISIFLQNATIVRMRLRNGTPRYLVHADGNPIYDNIENVSTTAVINADRGVVFMATTYNNPFREFDRVFLTFQYRFDAVNVTPPAWYDAARNATA